MNAMVRVLVQRRSIVNSLQDLNRFSGNGVPFADDRSLSITFNAANATSQSYTVSESVPFQANVGINFTKIQSVTANAIAYSINVGNVAGTQVTWNNLPDNIYLTSNGTNGLYTITNIIGVGQWNLVKSPYITTPHDFANNWVFSSNIRYGSQYKSWTNSVTTIDTEEWSTPNVATYDANYYTRISNNPTITDTNSGDNYDLTITPNTTSAISSIASSVAPLAVFNNSTKAFTTTGNKGLLNIVLSDINIQPAQNYQSTFILNYSILNKTSNLRSNVSQTINIGNIAPTLSNVSDNSYSQNYPVIVSGYPQILSGANDYKITIIPNNTSAVSTISSGDASNSFNTTSKILTVTGNLTTVNEALKHITVAPGIEYSSPFELTYRANIDISGSAYAVQTQKFNFSDYSYKLTQPGNLSYNQDTARTITSNPQISFTDWPGDYTLLVQPVSYYRYRGVFHSFYGPGTVWNQTTNGDHLGSFIKGDITLYDSSISVGYNWNGNYSNTAGLYYVFSGNIGTGEGPDTAAGWSIFTGNISNLKGVVDLTMTGSYPGNITVTSNATAKSLTLVGNAVSINGSLANIRMTPEPAARGNINLTYTLSHSATSDTARLSRSQFLTIGTTAAPLTNANIARYYTQNDFTAIFAENTPTITSPTAGSYRAEVRLTSNIGYLTSSSIDPNPSEWSFANLTYFTQNTTQANVNAKIASLFFVPHPNITSNSSMFVSQIQNNVTQDTTAFSLLCSGGTALSSTPITYSYDTGGQAPLPTAANFDPFRTSGATQIGVLSVSRSLVKYYRCEVLLIGGGGSAGTDLYSDVYPFYYGGGGGDGGVVIGEMTDILKENSTAQGGASLLVQAGRGGYWANYTNPMKSENGTDSFIRINGNTSLTIRAFGGGAGGEVGDYINDNGVLKIAQPTSISSSAYQALEFANVGSYSAGSGGSGGGGGGYQTVNSGQYPGFRISKIGGNTTPSGTFTQRVGGTSLQGNIGGNISSGAGTRSGGTTPWGSPRRDQTSSGKPWYVTFQLSNNTTTTITGNNPNFNFKGNVANYASLPTTGRQRYDMYRVLAPVAFYPYLDNLYFMWLAYSVEYPNQYGAWWMVSDQGTWSDAGGTMTLYSSSGSSGSIVNAPGGPTGGQQLAKSLISSKAGKGGVSGYGWVPGFWSTVGYYHQGQPYRPGYGGIACIKFYR